MDGFKIIRSNKSAIVSLLAALFCIVYILSFHANANYRSINANYPTIHYDSERYQCLANKIFSTLTDAGQLYCLPKLQVSELAHQGPGYPVILAPLSAFKDFGTAVMYMQLVLFVLGGFLLFRIIRDNGFGEPAIGTVLYFAYLPLGIYTNYVLTETRPKHRESLWKYQVTGDIRLNELIKLSGKTSSVLITKGPEGVAHENRDDLSSSLFRQSGSYNIRLQLITYDGKEYIL